MSWEIKKLADLSLLVKRGIAPKYVEQGGVSILNQKCIRNGVVSYEFSRLCSSEKKITEEKIIRQGDILVNSTGAGTLGRTGFVKEIKNTTTVDTHVTIVRGNKDLIDTKFLALQLSLKEPEIESMGKGATNQTELSAGDLGKLVINLPPLPTQKRIASMLSTYDDLIENNLKRIKLLEETAQNIYKEWFVNFRFPNYEHTEFDRESGLPVGWKNTEIKYFATVITGKTPSTSNLNYFGGDIPFIKTPDMHQNIYMDSVEQYLSVDGAESQSNKYLPKNTVIISCIGARAGVVAITSKPSQTNQQINAIISNDVSHNFWLYFSCKELESTIHAIGSSGATMTNVSKGKFENIKLNLPTYKILKEYDKVVECIFEQILILQQQNQKLKEARDILLPRLMNRTIEV
jgi:type I restriction enzyme S subunit